MNPTEGSHDGPADDAAHHERAEGQGLPSQLAGLRPVRPGPGVRRRIAADLAGVDRGDSAAPSRRRLGSVVERLAWAAGGAVAASIAFLVVGAAPTGREQAAVFPMTGVASEPPQAGRLTRVQDEPVGWSDEGIRFVDEFTPARVLRRTVIERHMADDGAAEVRVPREDVIFLPVALR